MEHEMKSTQILTYTWRALACFMLYATIQASGPLYAQARGPITPAPTERRRCALPSDELTGEVRLERGCYYEQAFEINTPDTTLDCQGAELRGDEAYLINIKREADRAVVRDCYLVGGKGIAVRVRKKRAGELDDEVRALSPQGVLLSNLHLSRSQNVGVHLLPYTVGVTIRDSVITDQDGPGLYLSPYSRGHHVINNLITHNGHRRIDGTPRLGWYRREGIAIDASSEHVIRGNEITHNALGGVLLYKNCWEHAAENPDTQPRTDHARANLIEENRFGEQPFGVWVASRQSRDLSMMGCGDPTPYPNPIFVRDLLPDRYYEHPSAFANAYITTLFLASVWPDFAEDNKLRGNIFEAHSAGGLRIEDDSTEVTGNLFVGDYDYLFLGSPFRAHLINRPIRDTIISGNSYYSPEGHPLEERLVLMEGEHVDTTLTENYRACLTNSGELLRHGALHVSSTEGERAQCLDGELTAPPLGERGAEEGGVALNAGEEPSVDLGSPGGERGEGGAWSAGGAAQLIGGDEEPEVGATALSEAPQVTSPTQAPGLSPGPSQGPSQGCDLSVTYKDPPPSTLLFCLSILFAFCALGGRGRQAKHIDVRDRLNHEVITPIDQHRVES